MGLTVYTMVFVSTFAVEKQHQSGHLKPHASSELMLVLLPGSSWGSSTKSLIIRQRGSVPEVSAFQTDTLVGMNGCLVCDNARCFPAG